MEIESQQTNAQTNVMESIAALFKSPEYVHSSLLIFKVNIFFTEQINSNDINRTGRTFDLLFNLGTHLQNETFHGNSKAGLDVNAWRHAVLAGIVPRSLAHAVSLNGHLHGVALNMLEKFCKSNYSTWTNAVMLKALGVLFFFLRS